MRAVSAVKRNICRVPHKAGIPIVVQVSIFHRGEPWKLKSWDGRGIKIGLHYLPSGLSDWRGS